MLVFGHGLGFKAKFCVLGLGRESSGLGLGLGLFHAYVADWIV